MANEDWTELKTKVKKGEIKLKENNTRLILLHGYVGKDPVEINIFSPKDKAITFDVARTDWTHSTINKFDKKYIAPNRVTKITSEYGATKDDKMLYNLTYKNWDSLSDKDKEKYGGKNPLLMSALDLGTGLGEYTIYIVAFIVFIIVMILIISLIKAFGAI